MALTMKTRPRLILPLAIGVTLAIVATILTVWAFERAGYTPCELCLLERQPFYAGFAVGLLTIVSILMRRWGLASIGFAVLALLFAAGTVIGVYHAGVEWKIWPGPSGCSGAVQAAAGVSDFMKQLESVKVVRCDAAALVVAGLSLAGWNAVISLGLLICSLVGLSRSRSA
ncbi:disulfide bond formation protein B [Lichenihabitans psoromatis]|uniref:disulfide bond formation protein B n=1 Tax=Lichenihabitans psoromatis TaxID=2528642 RepID=UPI001FDFFA84|nr:disulfide bond formation protein B [Lichenihabitans psoromatis]